MQIQESVAKTTFTKLPIEAKEDTKEKCKYLRSAHFSFGTDKIQPIPESKFVYSQKEPIPNLQDPKLAQDIRNSHIGYIFNPNHGGNVKSMGMTTYQERISEMAKSARGIPDREYKNLHRTNFLMGTDKCNFETEQKTKYFFMILKKSKIYSTRKR